MKLALQRAVEKGVVVQVSGTGANGSFKLPVQKTNSAKQKTGKKAAPKKKTGLKKKTAEAKRKAGRKTAWPMYMGGPGRQCWGRLATIT